MPHRCCKARWNSRIACSRQKTVNGPTIKAVAVHLLQVRCQEFAVAEANQSKCLFQARNEAVSFVLVFGVPGVILFNRQGFSIRGLSLHTNQVAAAPAQRHILQQPRRSTCSSSFICMWMRPCVIREETSSGRAVLRSYATRTREPKSKDLTCDGSCFKARESLRNHCGQV